jgi:hypothetical protein
MSRCHDPQELWEMTAVTHKRCLSNIADPHLLQKSLGAVVGNIDCKETNKPETNIDIILKGDDTRYNSNNNTYNVTRKFLNDFCKRVSPKSLTCFFGLEKYNIFVHNKRQGYILTTVQQQY